MSVLELRAFIAEAKQALAEIERTEIKYRHPTKPELTWTGRGRRPAWLATRKNIEKFRVL